MPPSRSRSASPEPTTTEGPESPSPSPSPDPTPTSPLFSASQSTAPQDPTTTTEDPWSQSLDGALPGDGADSPATPSAPRSTGRAKLRAIKETVRQAVATATGAAHQLLTRDGSPEREAGLWLPDDDDLEAISDPLAGLASRRAPSGVDNPDVTDLVRLALGVAGYLIKQMNVRANIAQYYAPEPQAAPPSDVVDPVTDVVPPVDPWSAAS